MQDEFSPPPVRIAVDLTINGERHGLEVEPWTSLLDLLRDRLDQTGTKKGCDHGQCGACTVLIDGKRVLSCLTLAVMQDGAEVTTIEGLSKDEELHALQAAFVEHDALQCGYCTPGQIMSAVGLLREWTSGLHNNASLTPTPLPGGEGFVRSPMQEADVRELMSGNLCRCGAYTNIVDAIEAVMRKIAEGER